MAAPGKQLQVILDDNTGNITYGGGNWTINVQEQWYGGATTYAEFAKSGNTTGSISLTFEGTSIAFIGNAPPVTSSQTALVSIDGGEAIIVVYPMAHAYIQWYQTAILSDGKHTITIDQIDNTAVDMAIITVGLNTPLASKMVFVDNDDPALQYSGTWIESLDEFNAGNLPDGRPVGNSTKRTMTPGDTMTFQFYGTSISVYGIFSWTNLSNLSATYTLDGVVLSRSYPVNTDSPHHINNDEEASNFQFFSKGDLSAGPHTLVLNITDVQNQVFCLDYLVYSPSFPSLASMPNPATVSPLPTSGGSTFSQENHHKKHIPPGAIVGAVMGGILIVSLSVILSLYLRTLRHKLDQQRLSMAVNNTESGLGHPISADGILNFPAVTTSTAADLKRSRLDEEHQRMGVLRFSTVLCDAPVAQTIVADEPPDSQPPAYDALATNSHIDTLPRR